jgi:hypothetical protein
MNPKSFLAQFVGFFLALSVEGLIHYHVYPITEVNTAKGALIVAFSFWPGMLLGYASVWFQANLAGEEDPDPSAAAALCAFLWFVYLFRAATLAIGLPALSNWTQAPVGWIVGIFEWLIRMGAG